MKMIVADDSRLIRGIIEKTAKAIGFDVFQAANGKDALNLLESRGKDVNIVLLDWNMPMMNGIDVLRNMRADDRFREIPVLMVSTESEDEKIKEAIEAGAHGYITKPFKADKLTVAIYKALGKRA